MIEPKVQVGIMCEAQIKFSLLGDYKVNGESVRGSHVVTYSDGQILWEGKLYKELLFLSVSDTGTFELQDVTIGNNFHWERRENQQFLGTLKIIVEDNKLTAINIIAIEDYLTSVISSEMSATASLELLKAHAVISRSWLLAQIQKEKDEAASTQTSDSFVQTENELIRWYDHKDHVHFDVCADDHCQRYQGITRESTEVVRQAIKETRGQVLLSCGKLCDARFSKCCGGALEEFKYCWEDKEYSYLAKRRDNKSNESLPDLRIESEADKWIRISPEAFCNTTDKHILSQVLNNYDQETTDFYRWKVVYSQAELSALIKERSGIDFGKIIDLQPVERGTSGRLSKLKIIGSKRTMVIGKELEIRRTLSHSHLYSSAFVVDKEDIEDGIPGTFILVGAGWGHGVGLCQIGAAVMGEQGYKYNDILLHYYTGAVIEQIYE